MSTLKRLAPLALALAASCQTVSTRGPRPIRTEEPSEVAALFPEGGPTTPEDQLAHLLDMEWRIPSDIRVALVQVSHRSEFVSTYWHGWSSALGSDAPVNVATEAVERLYGIDGVFDVSYLPGFLIAGSRSLGPVREAAARYQADWVFLYATTVRAKPDYRFFAENEVEGLCMVECALLDTRTGLIPFTSRSTSPIDEKARKGEDMPALVQRAEIDAVNVAMAKNARALAELVETVRSR